jgi:thymidylate synthase (FAD)
MRIVPNIILDKQVVPVDDVEMFKFAEHAGRLCWRSQSRITHNSYVSFLSSILEKGHGMVLEFTNVVFQIHSEEERVISDIRKHKESAKYITICGGTPDDLINDPKIGDRLFVGGSVRAWVDFFSDMLGVGALDFLRHSLNCEHSKGINNLISMVWPAMKFTRIVSTEDIPLPLVRYSVFFQTDRAVTHELVRHRTLSHLQESQRYIAQEKEVEFTHQWWWNSTLAERCHDLCSSCADLVRDHLEETEKLYHRLLQELPPEKARGILPNITTARIHTCGSLAHWKHLLNLRTTSRAYMQFRQLAAEVAQDFYARGWHRYLPATWMPEADEEQ